MKRRLIPYDKRKERRIGNFFLRLEIGKRLEIKVFITLKFLNPNEDKQMK